ncbi:hypothetical protein Tco_0213955 [Tanacetum coccineum]
MTAVAGDKLRWLLSDLISDRLWDIYSSASVEDEVRYCGWDYLLQFSVLLITSWVLVVRKRVANTLYSMQALLRAQLAVRSQRAHRSFKDHRVQPEIRHQKSTERFDNDTRSEIHSKRLSTSHDSIKNSYDESPKIAGMDPYRPHGQSRRNHYQDPERGFTGKDYKCSKTTRSTPRVAYSNRSNTPTRPPKSVCRDAFSRPYLNRPGIDETKACEEMDSKLNITNKKKQILVKRKRILEVDKPPDIDIGCLYLIKKYLARRNALSRIEDIEHLIEASQSIPVRRVDSKSTASTSASCGNTY